MKNITPFIKYFKIFLVPVLCLVCSFSWAIEKHFLTQQLNFPLPENIPQILNKINNSDVLIVALGFDPYESNILDEYLPEGYITVNGEYDINELIIKTFLNPVLYNENIKFLILDITPLLKNSSEQRVLRIKMLIEKMASYFAKNNRQIELGVKFKYIPKYQDSIDQFFSYTEMPLLLKSIQIESGYDYFFVQKSYLNYLGNLKYLDLSSNVIGSQKQNFDDFIYNLKKLKNLEILNLNNNAIGSLNGNLKLLGNQISHMPNLKYLNLQNNLIGAYKEDAREFEKSIEKSKGIVVNLKYNLN